MNPFFESAASHRFADDVLHTTFAQGLSGLFDAFDERILGYIAQYFAISTQRAAQFLPIMNRARLLPFAVVDSNGLMVLVKVADPQPDQFANAKPRIIEQMKNQQLPDIAAGAEKSAYLLQGEHFGMIFLNPWIRNFDHKVKPVDDLPAVILDAADA